MLTGRLFLAAHSVGQWLVLSALGVGVVARWGDLSLSVDVIASTRGRTVAVSELAAVVLAVTTPASVAPRMGSWEMHAKRPAMLCRKVFLGGLAIGLPVVIAYGAALESGADTLVAIGAAALGSSALLGPNLGAVVALMTYLGMLVIDVEPGPGVAVALSAVAVTLWSHAGGKHSHG